jgi:sugar phosphate isomerase/epimerase
MSTTFEQALGSLPFLRGVAIQPSLPLRQAVAEARDNQCTHVYVEGSYSADGAIAWTEEHFAEATQVLGESGIKPIFHGNYKNPLSQGLEELRRAAVAYTKREVEIAKRLDAPLIVHGSAIFSHGDPAKVRREAVESFTQSVGEVTEYATELGVQIWLENLEYYRDRHPFHTVFSNRDDYAYVLENVPDVNFILDVGHENISSGMPVQVFEEFADRIVAMDVNDNSGETDTHSPLGTGAIDFDGLLAAIERTEWRGYLTFETRGAKVVEGLEFLANKRLSLAGS